MTAEADLAAKTCEPCRGGIPPMDRAMAESYLVQVPGTAQTALPDSDLARLLNWMLGTFSAAQIPANFQPYTAAEVGTLRQYPLTSPSAVQAQLLAQIVQREQQPHRGAFADE